MRLRKKFAGCLLCLFVWLIATIPANAQPPGEMANKYRLEARYLYDIAAFVDWPPPESAPNNGALTFCVLGQDPFGAALNQSFLGHSIGGRQTIVERGKRLADMTHCDILYISSSEKRHLAAIIRKLRWASVITVGDTSDFASSGGVIEFTQEGDRVGFLINVDAAQRAGLRIGAPLLALARIVHEKDPNKN